LTLIFFISSFSNCYSQDGKIDFKASWKIKKGKSYISLTLTKGDLPVSCYVYDSSPFTGGQIIKQLENVVSSELEIEMEEKADVYICVYKDENTLAAKWLKTSE
jgi:hypothetical protein